MKKSILIERYGILRELTPKDTTWYKMAKNIIDSSWNTRLSSRKFDLSPHDIEEMKEELAREIGGYGRGFFVTTKIKSILDNVLTNKFQRWWEEGRFNGKRKEMMDVRNKIFRQLLRELT